MLPSSGAAICKGDRAEHGIAGRLEGDRLGAMIEAEPAELLGAVRAEQAFGLGERVQLGAQIVGGTMMPPARIGLEGHDLGFDEGVDLVLERLLFRRQREIHGMSFLD